MDYSKKLKDPRWQKKRLKTLERDGWKCVICECDYRTLHVHHRSYQWNQEPWDAPDSELASICDLCHFLISGFGVDFNVLKNIRRSKLGENLFQSFLEYYKASDGSDNGTFCAFFNTISDYLNKNE